LRLLDKLKQNADFTIARIFLAALELEEPNPEEFRQPWKVKRKLRYHFKRFNTIFETIISLAPLLGLQHCFGVDLLVR